MFQIKYLTNRTCHYFKILKIIYDLFIRNYAAISFSLYKKKKKKTLNKCVLQIYHYSHQDFE